MFSQAIEGNGTALFNMLSPNISSSNDLSRLAVTCLDSPQDVSPSAQDLADESVRTLKEVSRHFGVSTSVGEPDGGCQFWPVKGPERFLGPWNATLKIPMLIVTNTVRFPSFLVAHLLIFCKARSVTIFLRYGGVLR